MKKITLLLMLLSFSYGFSQSLVLGFETGESGGVNGGPFGNGPAPIVEMGTGSNTTQVLKIVGNPSGEVWQGINLTLNSSVNLTTNKTMTMDVFSDTPITFLVKVTGGSGGPAIVAASASHTGGSTWQTVSFTFDTALDGQGAPANGTYNGFVIHTYWAPGATTFATVTKPARTFYVDNIKGTLATSTCNDGIQNGDETGIDCGGTTCPACVVPPMTAAPTPPARPAADVVSIYSDAYTNLNFTTGANNFDAGWCGGAATTQVQIAGNNTLKKNLGVVCQGIDFQSTRQDLTSFTHIHFDFYVADTDLTGDVFNVKLVDFAGTNAEVSALEININGGSTPQLIANQWVSVDVPITALGGVVAGNLTRSDVAQIGITTAMVDNLWYDNLYLHKNTVLSNETFTASNVNMYPNPTNSTVNINSIENIDSVSIMNILGQTVINKDVNSNDFSLDISELNNGQYFLRLNSNNTTVVKKLIKN